MDFDMHSTDDVRIDRLRPLLPPAILMEEHPLSEEQARNITKARKNVSNVVQGKSDRLVVVVGPCSIHDTDAAVEYAVRLAALAKGFDDDLVVIMRTYFEKPRTTVGWKGLINDPNLDDTFAINEGLRKARKFLLDVLDTGLSPGTEFLDPITPQFLADLIAWGAIGARTSESQVHRELASGLSMPVGFKNGTAGSIQIAVDAIRSAAHPHHFLSVTKQGLAAIVSTQGNPDCHLILRGGSSGPNYEKASVEVSSSTLKKSSANSRLMIDCSHANSGKDHEKQPLVLDNVCEQIKFGNQNIMGVMLESFLQDGRQDPVPGSDLVKGQSITDKCMSFERTEPLFERMANAIQARRQG
ncbi:MAG: 3-deoxy-7-phosphoheptulonate synthase [Deltaproteobacteria bacterium]|nr:3-deoxy-7-phosphoheptulonate synthase [Deltaproteobacteria bacterium]